MSHPTLQTSNAKYAYVRERMHADTHTHAHKDTFGFSKMNRLYKEQHLLNLA